MYIYVYICTYIYICAHIYTHIYKHKHTYINVSTLFTYRFLHACTQVYIHIHVCACVDICKSLDVIYIYIYLFNMYILRCNTYMFVLCFTLISMLLFTFFFSRNLIDTCVMVSIDVIIPLLISRSSDSLRIPLCNPQPPHRPVLLPTLFLEASKLNNDMYV